MERRHGTSLTREVIKLFDPCFQGNEKRYLEKAINGTHLSGGGLFTKSCQKTISELTGHKNVHLSHSCTAALELSAILLDIKPSDEVIMPSFTFTSTANAFVLRGAVRFC